jgi:hypothetical protein
MLIIMKRKYFTDFFTDIMLISFGGFKILALGYIIRPDLANSYPPTLPTHPPLLHLVFLVKITSFISTYNLNHIKTPRLIDHGDPQQVGARHENPVAPCDPDGISPRIRVPEIRARY